MNSQYLLLLVRNFRPHGETSKSFDFSKKSALILRIHGASVTAEHIGQKGHCTFLLVLWRHVE